jgi:hypothetical protein
MLLLGYWIAFLWSLLWIYLWFFHPYTDRCGHTHAHFGSVYSQSSLLPDLLFSLWSTHTPELYPQHCEFSAYLPDLCYPLNLSCTQWFNRLASNFIIPYQRLTFCRLPPFICWISGILFGGRKPYSLGFFNPCSQTALPCLITESKNSGGVLIYLDSQGYW